MNSTDQIRDAKRAGLLVTLARDLISVACLGILLLCIHELATPFTRGFFCDDETIRYPHKDSTISSGVCYLVGSSTNIILILLLEYVLLVDEIRSSNNRDVNKEFPFRIYIRNVYCRIVVWFFGAISSELLTDISKVTAGRLRPHFIEVCKPLIFSESSNQSPYDEYCRNSSNRYQYITNYSCTGIPSRQRDIRLSFMSGHSSYSAYSAAFAVFYIQSALDVKKLGLLKPALQVLIISAAFYTGLTRISDYKHHWQDVLAGLTQGTSVAAVVSLYLLPPIYETYTKGTIRRVGDSLTGEELNRVSY